MNKKVCSVLKYCISMTMALFSIFTLFFSLWKINGGSLGFYSDNGFDFLGFCSKFSTLGTEVSSLTENISSYSILTGICLWLQLLFSLIYISLLIIILFKKIYKSNETSTYKNSIYNLNNFCVMFSVIYMVLGIACRKTIINIFLTVNPDLVVGINLLVSTLSYIPFIISAVLLIAYVVVCLLENIEPKETKTVNVQTKVVEHNTENVLEEKKSSLTDIEKIALLSKYHELVDNNVLSQEDFERKKKEILGL